MVPLLWINFAMSLAMLLLSYYRATVEALDFYPATIPIMVQAALAALLALIGLYFRRVRFVFLLLSGLALGLLGVPAMHALSGWPGGDDGGAFGWFFLVGGASGVSAVVALITMILGCMRRSSEQPSSYCSSSKVVAFFSSRSRSGMLAKWLLLVAMLLYFIVKILVRISASWGS